MVRPRSGARLVWLGLIAFLQLLTSLPTHAQAPAVDPIQVFQNMTPDQQRALLDSLGRGDGRTRDTTSPEQASRSDRDRRDRLGTRGERQDRQDRDMMLEEFEREPRLEPLDTLLLGLEIREYKGQNGAEYTPPAVAPQASPGQPTVVAPPPREPIVRSQVETDRLRNLRTQILRRNPLQLDKWGILTIPELGPIPLGGLTAEEAKMRLAADPLLADFVVKVTYLPVKPVGAKGLKPFGHDLFKRAPDTFAPATDIPVPAEYVVGPGDTLEVQLTGNTKGRHSLVVRRDGRISFPDLGPIAVSGLRFDAVRSLIEQRVIDQLIGTQASVQIGELRSIQVFVVGDAIQPGSYTVSGLSTITNALFVSGGVTEVGSLRNIELKRGGRTVSRLDFYDLLLSGDVQSDQRLQSGDVIFVPPIGRVVGVSGEVRRPALYELKSETTVSQLVKLAGGLTSEAEGPLATVERIDARRQRIVLDVDLTASGAGTPIQDGDILNVPTIRPTLDDSVIVEGHVHRPGPVAYRTGLRISDVISSLEELKPTADQHYVLVRREVLPTRRLEFVSADLVAALAQRGGQADLQLAPRDRIFVFDLETGRDRLLQPLLQETRLQSTRDAPRREVTIGGRVNSPGAYPLERGMKVSDLIRAGGSLSEAAYGGKAELTRNVIDGGEVRRTDLIEIDLSAALAGNASANLELQPFDYLVVKELPLWGAQEYVELQGEVRFPGRYPIQRGENLRSVILRAGGFTELSFVQGAVFTRETLKERERKQIDQLTKRLQVDLAQVSLMTAQESRGGAADALAVGNQLLENLRNTEPVGRLVVRIEPDGRSVDGSGGDIVLKDGDRLLVPRITQEVTVIGEVQSPTSHLYDRRLSRDEYIGLSGGTTQRADDSRTYVVRADGSIEGGRSNRWFGGAGTSIRAGDTIVVPLDAERVRALPVITAVSTVVANLAISAAALAAL